MSLCGPRFVGLPRSLLGFYHDLVEMTLSFSYAYCLPFNGVQCLLGGVLYATANHFRLFLLVG